PRAAYAMGLIDVWARCASHMPRLANFISHTEPCASLFKSLGAIAPQRDIPMFAEKTFVAWFVSRPVVDASVARPEGHSLARHVYQSLPSRHCQGCRGGAGSRRVSGKASRAGA